ncbi:MAG: hypothetical protein CW691_04100 [Candidatus Bathyarchaeum sp.]|nr:MAG: hypothetical protein CW691_04100 [Candidatus Bathyarchaeum sp.]
MKKWVNVIWGILGFLMFLAGFSSQNVVTMTIGSAIVLGNVSLHLTLQVNNDKPTKRALEVLFLVATFGVFGCGYIVTQSLMLGLMITFIVAMTLVAFTATYLLPKIRDKPKNTN